jgi:two-component system nitrate/nitrite response regulator NarL
VIRVIVAARSSISRAGLESVVHSSPALELVRSLDFALLLNHTEGDLNADVLLLEAGDIQPDRVRVLAGLPLPAVLLVDMPDAALVNAALSAGIRGVLSREATLEEIEAAVHAVSVGLVVVGGAEMPAVIPQGHAVSDVLAEPLSDREIEVLELIVEGLSNKLIAYQLSISEHTVKTHVASILAKLGVASRTEAVSQAVRRGLVKL